MRFDFANLKNDRGNIGVLMALVLFTVVGSLCMTWNTAQLSKEKMRLQNAADSAALGFCTWQARGMNAVQNINDEMYMSLGMAISLQKITIGVEIPAHLIDGLAHGPLAFLKAVSVILHSIGVLCGGTSGLIATKVVPWVLVPAGYFYAYGSCALGYLSAQQLAADNRADPVGLVNVKLPGGFGNLGLFALGFAYPFMDTLKLPLEQKELSSEPWKSNAGLATTCKGLCKTSGGLWGKIYNVCGTGEKWQYKPWISPKDEKTGQPRRPGPAVFMTYKVGKHIERISLDSWKKDFSSSGVRKMPMFAIAAAQCITGDVIEASKDPKKGYPRGRGHGTGATAKLVTVAYALGEINGTFGKVIGAAIYH